jgi:hypothetical protein
VPCTPRRPKEKGTSPLTLPQTESMRKKSPNPTLPICIPQHAHTRSQKQGHGGVTTGKPREEDQVLCTAWASGQGPRVEKTLKGKGVRPEQK